MSINRDKNVKKHTEILALKNTITGLKISLESFNSRLDQAEERIDETKKRSLDIIHSEEKIQKKMKEA